MSGLRATPIMRTAAALSLVIVTAALLAFRASGLRATYYADSGTQPVYTRVDQYIDVDTLTANAPVSPDQPFSVQWSGYLLVPRTAIHTFDVRAEGEVSLSIEHVNAAGAPAFSPPDGPVRLEPGSRAIAISYRHRGGRYGIDVSHAREGDAPQPLSLNTLAPTRRLPWAYRVLTALRWAGLLVAGAWLLAGAVWIVRRVTLPLIAALSLSTIFLTLAVVYDTPAWIRGPAPWPDEWQWGYHGPDAIRRVGPALLGALGVVASLAFARHGSSRDAAQQRRRARVVLAVALACGALFQFGVLHLGQGGALATAAETTRSDRFTGYFSVAEGSPNARTILTRYAAMLPTFPVHARTHPPGPVLYYRGLIDGFRAAPRLAIWIVETAERLQVPVGRFTRASRSPTDAATAAAALVGGLSVALIVVLTGWPLALIVEAAGASATTAAAAGALWTLCPAVTFFALSFDGVITFLVCTACLFGIRSVSAARSGSAFGQATAAGVSAGLALLASFGAAPWLVVAAITVLLVTRGRAVPFRRVAGAATVAACSGAAVLAAPMLFGFDLAGTFRGAMALHREHYTEPRSRELWMRFNLLDLSIFLGWPICAWAVATLMRARRPKTVILWFMVAAVAIVDVADLTRAEVGRVWMPLMPFLIVAVALAEPDQSDAGDRVLVGACLAVTSIVLSLHWTV